MKIKNKMTRMQTSSYRTLILNIFCFGVLAVFASTVSAQATRTVTVVTEPNAKIWLDDILRGTTDESGKLEIKSIAAGAHKIRVRADGFKETSQNLTAVQKGEVKIALVKTEDAAELAFQEAERLSLLDRQKAIAAYRKAVSLRPTYAEAHLTLARTLADANDMEGARAAVAAARKARPGYAEASAVEGRIYKSEGDEEKAIASYKRAIAEGKNFQPEALTGLGLIYNERAEIAGGGGDFQAEEENLMLAAGFFRKAVTQLGGAPDAITIYQLLGLAYEKTKKYPEAIAVYEEFLRVFPDATEATAVKSFIVQLKKQMTDGQ